LTRVISITEPSPGTAFSSVVVMLVTQRWPFVTALRSRRGAWVQS